MYYHLHIQTCRCGAEHRLLSVVEGGPRATRYANGTLVELAEHVAVCATCLPMVREVRPYSTRDSRTSGYIPADDEKLRWDDTHGQRIRAFRSARSLLDD